MKLNIVQRTESHAIAPHPTRPPDESQALRDAIPDAELPAKQYQVHSPGRKIHRHKPRKGAFACVMYLSQSW
jgi:hypothetical protein